MSDEIPYNPANPANPPERVGMVWYDGWNIIIEPDALISEWEAEQKGIDWTPEAKYRLIEKCKITKQGLFDDGYCSICNAKFYDNPHEVNEWNDYNFCPYCGGEIEGGE